MNLRAGTYALVMLFAFGTYLVPEHYLKHFHPHEHPTCSHGCHVDHDSFTEQHDDCDDEKEYFFPPLPGTQYVALLRPCLLAVFTPKWPSPSEGFTPMAHPRGPPAIS
jgi:hypothetical protein